MCVCVCRGAGLRGSRVGGGHLPLGLTTKFTMISLARCFASDNGNYNLPFEVFKVVLCAVPSYPNHLNCELQI